MKSLQYSSLFLTILFTNNQQIISIYPLSQWSSPGAWCAPCVVLGSAAPVPLSTQVGGEKNINIRLEKYQYQTWNYCSSLQKYQKHIKNINITIVPLSTQPPSSGPALNAVNRGELHTCLAWLVIVISIWSIRHDAASLADKSGFLGLLSYFYFLSMHQRLPTNVSFLWILYSLGNAHSANKRFIHILEILNENIFL